MSLGLHGVAAAALALVGPGAFTRPPSYSLSSGGGGGRGGVAPHFTGSFSTSREVAQRLAKLRIEPVKSSRPAKAAAPVPLGKKDDKKDKKSDKKAKPRDELATSRLVAKVTTTPVKVLPPPTALPKEKRTTVPGPKPLPAKTPEPRPTREANAGKADPQPAAATTGPKKSTDAAARGQHTAAGTVAKDIQEGTSNGPPAPAATGYPVVAANRVARQVAGPVGDGLPPGPGGHGSREPVGAIENPFPPYPADALARGAEGLVILRLWIHEDGSVQQVEIHQSSGDRSLDEAALTTVRDHWQFSPALENGRPTQWKGLKPFRFQLPRR